MTNRILVRPPLIYTLPSFANEAARQRVSILQSREWLGFVVSRAVSYSGQTVYGGAFQNS
jgi:hypothetical protein